MSPWWAIEEATASWFGLVWHLQSADGVLKSFSWISEKRSEGRSVVSNSLRPHTVHGILQAITPEWVAFPFSRGSSQPRDRTQVSRVAGGFFTS